MASYPPPNPYTQPPYGAPYFQNPRDQRRLAREQAKAQRSAFKAQRELYRQQSRSLRRSSLVGPLLVLGFGVVALLVSLGRLSMASVALWFSHWWPLLIVAAGLILVAEWAFDQSFAGDGAVPQGRRSLGGGAVFLLILLVVAGLFSQAIHANRADAESFFNSTLFSGNSNGWNEVFEEKYDREQQIDQAFAPGTSLSVDNPRGAVVILGRSADDKIHITINKQIFSRSQTDADSKASQLVPQFNMAAGGLHLSMPTMEGATADLNITVPDSAQTSVNAGRGDVRISDLRAPVNVTANRGDVELNQIGGAATTFLNSSHSSFAAHNIQGNVELRGKADDLSVTDVSGTVVLNGEFYGDTHLEHLASTMQFHTGRTQFSLAKLDGEVDMSPDSELTGSRIAGPVELHTRNRNVNLTDVAGNVLIANSNGSVEVSDLLPLGNISIDNRNGSVTLTVPDTAGATFRAETHEGSLHNDFALPVTTEGNRKQLAGTVGNGAAQISINTTHDDITIHKQAVSQAPVPQQPPRPPTTKHTAK